MTDRVNKWIRWDKRKPEASAMCDFLFAGDDVSPHVWMMCSCAAFELFSYEGTPTHWRKAEKLPRGCGRIVGSKATFDMLDRMLGIEPPKP